MKDQLIKADGGFNIPAKRVKGSFSNSTPHSKSFQAKIISIVHWQNEHENG